MVSAIHELSLYELDEAITNAHATLKATRDRDQREAVEDYLDALLDQRGELTRAR